MQTFLNTFSIESINEGFWNQMKQRLEQPIEKQIHQSNHCHHIKPHQNNKSNRYMVHLKEFPKGSADFDGIINYFRKQTNNQIENEIEMTASSIDEEEYGPYNTIQYETQSWFCTQNDIKSWICFEFKNHQIMPTHYTIRTARFGFNAPINYKIEVSNDNSEWYVIDRINGGRFREGQKETFTFSIDEKKQKEAKYICLIQTGQNSSGTAHLSFESIEFYGFLK